MKTLLTALVGMLFAASAAAQETVPPKWFAFTTPCDDISAMTQTIEKYNELPLAAGDGQIRHATGQLLTGTVTVWLEPSGTSFSITFDNGDLACMIANGKNMYPGAK